MSVSAAQPRAAAQLHAGRLVGFACGAMALGVLGAVACRSAQADNGQAFATARWSSSASVVPTTDAGFQLRGTAAGASARAETASGSGFALAVVAAAACCSVAGVLRPTKTAPTAAAPQRRVVRQAVASGGIEAELVTSVNPDDGPQGTYQVGIDFCSWLQSAQEEIREDDLRVEGKLPAWLVGSLVHAGPAKFEFGEDELVDWVDGQAMLYKVQIRGDNHVGYQNRWLDTMNHRAHREAGKIAVRETCSRPSIDSFFERFMALFRSPNNENGNLHISQMCGNSRPVSMSVGSSIIEFSNGNLDTLGKVPFVDELNEDGPLIFHAEPHVDPVTGEWYTCAIQLKINTEKMGLEPEYVVFSVEPSEAKEPGAPVKRKLITRIETEHPSPVHTIGLTERFIVMIQIPYPLNWDGMINAEAKWLMTGKYDGNLNDYNTWEPHRPTIIHLIDRETGEHTAKFEADPFFFFHVVNAFEEKGGENNSDDLVYLDVVCYNEPPVGFPMKQAREGDVEDWRGGGGEVRRFVMNITTGSIDCIGWPDNCFDEPKINPKVDGKRNKYSFGVVDYHGTLRLVKLNHDTQEVAYWEGQDISRELPWQPVFVPEPYNEREDAGVLMAFTRDQPTGNNFVVVLDTTTFEEIARIHFPEGHHIPLHGHGHFLPGKL